MEDATWDAILQFLAHFLQFWRAVFSNLTFTSITFTMPIITGSVIGHLQHPRWTKYAWYIWLCYSVLYGYAIMFLLSIPINIFSFLIPNFQGCELVLLYIFLLAIGVVGGVKVFRRERKEREELKRKIRELEKYIGVV